MSLSRAALCVWAFFACAAGAWAADPSKVLRMEFYVAETGFDPAKIQDYYSQTVCEAIFEPLLTYDYLARPSKLVPRAAEAMPTVSDDGKTYTFKLRKGIYFAPDPIFKGKRRELTAEDYVYTLERLKDPANHAPYESFIDGIVGLDELKERAEKSGKFDYDAKIEGLRALDRYTFQVKLKKTNYNFPFLMAMPTFGAVAREVIEAYAEDTNSHPVGTGPYLLKEWKRSSRIVLEANPVFRGFVWDFKPSGDALDQEISVQMRGKSMPRIGRVEINVIEEQQAMWLAFQNDELDVLYLREQISPLAIVNGKLAPNLAKRGIKLNRITDPDINYTYINTTDAQFGGFSKEKIALRRAIFMSFDNAEYLRIIRKNQALEENFLIPPGVAGNDPTYRSSVQFNPDLANKLLDKFDFHRASDGYRTWPDGRPLVWRYSSTPTSRDREMDELWQKSVSRIGIRLEVVKNKFPEELKAERACQLLSRTAAWIADYPDGDDFMQLLYGPNIGENNGSCFQLPEWDRLYEKSKTLPDSPERNQLYREMWRLAEVNGAWKMHDTRYRNMLLQPRVIGYKKHPILLAEFLYFDLDTTQHGSQ